jgi:hypothetical protein
MTETCIAAEIWRTARAGGDMETAQGRAQIDRNVRARLAEITDADLRNHAAEIIRQKRRATYFKQNRTIEDRLDEIEDLLIAIRDATERRVNAFPPDVAISF